MIEIQGGCHCRAITYTFDWPGSHEIPVRACSCSFCLKHCATYTSHPEARLEATIERSEDVRRYRFGTSTADFHLCCRCGCIAFATSEIEGDLFAVVNVHTFDELSRFDLVSRVTDFEGESVEERLSRRRRTWTPEVVVTSEAG